MEDDRHEYPERAEEPAQAEVAGVEQAALMVFRRAWRASLWVQWASYAVSQYLRHVRLGDRLPLAPGCARRGIHVVGVAVVDARVHPVA